MNPNQLFSWFDRPIAFHRCLVDVCGSINAALMLSQMFYWSKRTTKSDFWFYKSRKEWEEETGLTRHEQDRARKALKDQGLILEKRSGMPATVHFKIDFKVCVDRLLQTGNLDDRKAAILTDEVRQSEGPESGNHSIMPKTTSENTTSDFVSQVMGIFNTVKLKSIPGGNAVKANHSRAAMILARRKEGNELAQFQAVIGYKFKQWSGTEMEKYLTPDTLFRPSKFLKYLEEARDNYQTGPKKLEADPTKVAYS